MDITDEMRDSIKEIWNTCIHEGVSGRLFCTNNGLIRIAKVLGMDYKIMGKDKKRNFRADVISGYQMGVFQKRQDY